MQSFPLLSIVSPVYHAEDLIDELVERLLRTLSSLTDHFEILLVEDGGRDKSWAKIEAHCAKNCRVKGIQLSRNFGQHSAIAAGIEAARGEWIIVMDCDLQDRPEEILPLYRKAKEGYDIVLARRVQRNDSWLKWFLSKAFYTFLSFLSGIQYDSAIANFGIYHRTVISSLIQIQNSLHYFPSMVHWVGFKRTCIAVENALRPSGKSSYNLRKKLNLAFNIMLSYSNRPLKLIVSFGILISVIAFLFGFLIAYRAWRHEIAVVGYSSLIVSISFFSGVIISLLGILGLYIGKIFDSAKLKPAYLIKKRLNNE